MALKMYSLVIGIFMLALGIIATIPGLEGSSTGLPQLRLYESYGLFLDLFPMNIMNKMALMIFGGWGILASRNEDPEIPVMYARINFYVMGSLAILGLFEATNTLFGYWPLYGYEVYSHAVLALVAGYFGFVETRIHHTHSHA